MLTSPSVVEVQGTETRRKRHNELKKNRKPEQWQCCSSLPESCFHRASVLSSLTLSPFLFLHSSPASWTDTCLCRCQTWKEHPHPCSCPPPPTDPDPGSVKRTPIFIHLGSHHHCHHQQRSLVRVVKFCFSPTRQYVTSLFCTWVASDSSGWKHLVKAIRHDVCETSGSLW